MITQSLLTAGFHSRTCEKEMPASEARSVQDKPSVTMIHSLQSAGKPDIVGPGGVREALVGVAPRSLRYHTP